MTEEREFDKAMVVIAHADDAEFGCSGTVAKLCSEGWEVVYVMCTDGSKGSGDRNMSREKLAQIRHQEQLDAGTVLGLKDVVFLDNEDSLLQPTLELRRDIAREIRRHRPDILICPYPMRTLDGAWGVGHPDHIAAGEAALSALFPTARDHMSFPELLEENLEPHKVAEAWIMSHPEPDHWVDVTKHLDTSIKSLEQHVSQVSNMDQDRINQVMKEGRRKQAKGRGMQYAESFKRIIMK